MPPRPGRETPGSIFDRFQGGQVALSPDGTRIVAAEFDPAGSHHLAMRRFLCKNPACTKVTFAGQADGLTARYQRWSVPLRLGALLTTVSLTGVGLMVPNEAPDINVGRFKLTVDKVEVKFGEFLTVTATGIDRENLVTGEPVNVAARFQALARPGGGPVAAAARLRGYASARRRAFLGKWIVERMIGYAMYAPWLFDRAVARLERRGLSHTLIGVTGDYVPASAVLNPSFLMKMVM